VSFELLETAWLVECSAPCKLVLISLAYRANADGMCWPSIARLVADTGLARRTVQRSVRELRALGHLSERAHVGGSNVYTVHPGGELVHRGGRQRAARGCASVAQEVRHRGAPVRQRGAGGAPPWRPEQSVNLQEPKNVKNDVSESERRENVEKLKAIARGIARGKLKGGAP